VALLFYYFVVGLITTAAVAMYNGLDGPGIEVFTYRRVR
jgi:hypothetical protein